LSFKSIKLGLKQIETMIFKSKYLVTGLASLFFANMMISCSESNKEVEFTDENSAKGNELLQEVFYQIPAPSEIFEVMKEVKEKGIGTEILNPIDNSQKYLDNKSKSLNFGVYTSNLLYTAIFNYGSETLKYFATVKKLADELGLSSSIDENMMKRVENNMENSDSLTLISNDLFYSASENLEKNERGATLALVIAGGWVESIYLATSVFPTFDPENIAIQRVADQKLTYENLEEYLKMYSEDPQVNDVLNKITPLGNIFKSLKEESVGTSKAEKTGNSLVISGGSKILITADEYNKIKEESLKVRNSFTQATI
jgi:hypothetical protein